MCVLQCSSLRKADVKSLDFAVVRFLTKRGNGSICMFYAGDVLVIWYVFYCDVSDLRALLLLLLNK